MRQAIQQVEAEFAATLTPEQRLEDERRARRAAYTKRWSPEPHAREADLVLGMVDYDNAARQAHSDYWTQKAARALFPPTPKQLPPSAPPAPTQAQAASEAPLSVDGARRSSTPKS